jgi:hypothetical protein
MAVIGMATVATAAQLPREWRHWSRFREIQIQIADEADPGAAEKLVRVAVPEALFKRARSDLADLRVVDDRGEDVGYVLYASGRGPETAWRPTELSDVGFVPGSYTQVVADTGEEGTVHNAVEVTLPLAEEEFFTWVEVAVSEDQQTWRIVRGKAPLYRFRQRGFGRAVSIHYPRTRDQWLRLRLLAGGEEVPIERLRVAERVDEESELVPIRRGLARLSDSPEGESWWEPYGEMPLVPIASVRVATDRDAFFRPVTVSVSDDGRTWREVGRGQVYRYGLDESAEPSGEPAALRQSVQLKVENTAAPFWRVVVYDRGDPPIDDLTVTLLQNRRYVIFRPAAGRTYRLAYGNQRAEAPEYELGKITTRDQQANARVVELGPERTNDAWVSSEPFTERHPVILWLALGLAVAVLGWMAIRALR